MHDSFATVAVAVVVAGRDLSVCKHVTASMPLLVEIGTGASASGHQRTLTVFSQATVILRKEAHEFDRPYVLSSPAIWYSLHGGSSIQ
jgi:hypothetical protein